MAIIIGLLFTYNTKYFFYHGHFKKINYFFLQLNIKFLHKFMLRLESSNGWLVRQKKSVIQTFLLIIFERNAKISYNNKKKYPRTKNDICWASTYNFLYFFPKQFSDSSKIIELPSFPITRELAIIFEQVPSCHRIK